MPDPSAILAVAATAGGVILGVAPITQIRLIVRRRSSDGVSTSYWLVLAAAMLLWLAYGISIGNLAMVTANTVSLLMAVAMAAVAYRYRTTPAASAAALAPAE